MSMLPCVRFKPMPKNWQSMGKQLRCFVITSGAELDSCCGSVQPEINFERYVVLAAYRGECPTGGYWIKIMSAAYDREAGHMQVEVEEGTPGPEDMVTMAFTYPIDLVLIERKHLSPGEMSVEFRTRRRLLAQLQVTV